MYVKLDRCKKFYSIRKVTFRQLNDAITRPIVKYCDGERPTLIVSTFVCARICILN